MATQNPPAEPTEPPATPPAEDTPAAREAALRKLVREESRGAVEDWFAEQTKSRTGGDGKKRSVFQVVDDAVADFFRS